MEQRLTNRQKQAIRTKQKLFNTAVELFNENGYDNVTVEQITATAGVAKGTFYTYFRSKSDIVIEEFRKIDDYYRKYHRNLQRYKSAEDRIKAFTRAQMRYVRDSVGLRMLKLLYINNIENPDVENILIDPTRYLHVIVLEIIEYGQEQGEFRTDLDSTKMAYFFNRALRSVFLDYSISDARFDLVDEGVDFCTTVLIPYLRKHPQTNT